MRRATSLFSALTLVGTLAVGLLAGCQPPNAPVAMKRRDRTYKKIVSLSPSTTEVVASGLQISSLAGRTAACNFPSYSVEKVPIVATVKPDWEKLAEVRPDFIVYDALLYSPQDVEKMKETGATLFGFTAKTIDEYRTQVFELANFLGGSSRASDYLDRIVLAKNDAMASAPEPRRKVAVVMPGTNGQHMIAGTDSFVADEVRGSGGEPVGPKSDRFVPLSPEALVSLNPDVIIVPAKDQSDASGALAIANDARLKSVTAIREKRIGAVLGDVLLRAGGRVDQCIKAMYRIISAS